MRSAWPVSVKLDLVRDYASDTVAHETIILQTASPLIRFPGNARQTLAASVLQLVREYADQVAQAFVVIEPGRIRFSQKSA